MGRDLTVFFHFYIDIYVVEHLFEFFKACSCRHGLLNPDLQLSVLDYLKDLFGAVPISLFTTNFLPRIFFIFECYVKFVLECFSHHS